MTYLDSSILLHPLSPHTYTSVIHLKLLYFTSGPTLCCDYLSAYTSLFIQFTIKFHENFPWIYTQQFASFFHCVFRAFLPLCPLFFPFLFAFSCPSPHGLLPSFSVEKRREKARENTVHIPSASSSSAPLSVSFLFSLFPSPRAAHKRTNKRTRESETREGVRVRVRVSRCPLWLFPEVKTINLNLAEPLKSDYQIHRCCLCHPPSKKKLKRDKIRQGKRSDSSI